MLLPSARQGRACRYRGGRLQKRLMSGRAASVALPLWLAQLDAAARERFDRHDSRRAEIEDLVWEWLGGGVDPGVGVPAHLWAAAGLGGGVTVEVDARADDRARRRCRMHDHVVGEVDPSEDALRAPRH